jgi:aspartyl-tRNA(Asn)/glutamyl-tRNA(Gln) amidotransferase subunit B
MSVSEELRSKYQLVVGLEVHAQLLTNSKAYSSDANEYGDLPNTHISVVTLAHPGTLPVHNTKVVEYGVKMGLATNCSITRYNYFDRKNYFYPDLPKGYQITQDKTPICRSGFLDIKLKEGVKRIGITRIHMEEDAGKSIHIAGEEESLIDLNRAGVPLVEIVSEPDIRTTEEAYAYLAEVKRLVRYLEICDGNMEEGSLRCDANISVMLKGATEYGRRVEVKNMNSFRNVVRAIDFEMDRQIELVEAGKEVSGETRMFDATTGETYSLRSKENLNDYRYFPEPDLQPFVVTDEWLAGVTQSMPPLPQALYKKFTETYLLPEYDANVLVDNKETALFFESVAQYSTHYKAISNWIIGPVKGYLNELTLSLDQFPISPERLAELANFVELGKVSFAAASQKIFPVMLENQTASPEVIAKELDIIQEGDETTLLPIIDEVLIKFADKVQQYKNGKTGLLGLFVGEVMKVTKGKADPKLTNQLVLQQLEK